MRRKLPTSVIEGQRNYLLATLRARIEDNGVDPIDLLELVYSNDPDPTGTILRALGELQTNEERMDQ